MTERSLIGGLAALLVLGTLSAAHATPLYTARAGRTCDNCHSLPNSWYDPEDVSKRKCTLSCTSCHVDPSGGGLRNASGRYYDETVLPTWLGRRRALEDEHRGLFAPLTPTTASAPSSQPTSGPVKPAADRPVDPRPEGSPAPTRGPAWGTPALAPAEMAWLDGRYEDQKADPLLLLGGDLRNGMWSRGPLFFPMQIDGYAAIHPVEHLTLSTTVGGRGRARTPGSADPADQDLVGVRDLWLMLHELPYLGYARVGRFLPAFGWKVEDHTAYTRRAFGLSQEDPANRVVGGEIGFSGNYPYVQASAFGHSTPDARNPVGLGDGWGGAVNGGWRDLGWQLGASAMVRRRPVERGGDTTDVSLQWGFNPWRYWKDVPLTYLGELSAGLRQRRTGAETVQHAQYHQLAWSVQPGLTLRARYDFWDPDHDLKDDHIHRPGVGFDWGIIPGVSLLTDVRVGMPAGGDASADLFGHVHAWF